MKNENAYFTVEAALVLPLIMSAMLLEIYLFCFQYDRCLLEQDMGSLVLWSSAAAAENAGDTMKTNALMQLRAADIYQEKYVAWKTTGIDVRLEKNRISVLGSGELTFPVPGWNLWNDSSLWKTDASFLKSRLSPVFYIRQYHKVAGLLSDKNNEEQQE